MRGADANDHARRAAMTSNHPPEERLTPILGVVADDFTGATDVASMLVRSGMRTMLAIGVPREGAASAADAVVVALKSRTIPPADAVRESLAAIRWLRDAGVRQFYFKYCSTFDSTAEGNIGPVAEAMMDALGTDFTIACPAFPENGRTIYRGHLFVGDRLLSDTGMRDHPLTPMTESNLVRLLQAQCQRTVGLIDYDTVHRGVDAVASRVDELRRQGVGLAVADATDNDDLRVLASACADLPLLTAGSGLALVLPALYAERGWLRPNSDAARLDPVGDSAAVVSGSCSDATLEQVERWRTAGRPVLEIDSRQLVPGNSVVEDALAWARPRLADGPVLVSASARSEVLRESHVALGAARAGALVEQTLAALAAGLVDAGVQRLVVAGGETSGAVVTALGIQGLRVGPTISPGVPWTQAQAQGRALWLALKSGNFGGPEFFSEALSEPVRTLAATGRSAA